MFLRAGRRINDAAHNIAKPISRLSTIVAPTRTAFGPLFAACGLLSLLPAAHALANPGAAFTMSTLVGSFIANVIFSLIEGVILAVFAKVKWYGAIPLMLVANFFSALVGLGLMGPVTDVAKLAFGDDGLYTIGRRLALVGVMVLILGILLEWPIIAIAFANSARRWRKAFKWSVIVNTITFAGLVWYWLTGWNTSLFWIERVPLAALTSEEPKAWVYYITSDGMHVERSRLDGSSREQLPLEVAGREWMNVKMVEAGHFKILDQMGADLVATTPGQAGHIWKPMYEEWGGFSFGQYGWDTIVFEPRPRYAVTCNSGHMLEITDGGPDAHDYSAPPFCTVGWATPYEGWTVNRPTLLPSGVVVFDLYGRQVCVLELRTGRIARLAHGRCPVVIFEP